MAARAAQGTFVKKLLQTLTEALGPAGYEDEVREIVRSEIKPFVDEINVDALGNLSARKRPGKITKNSRKVMVAAHMDEIGMVVSHVEKNGFVRFSPLGSVLRQYAPGARVRFLSGTRGVIGIDPLSNNNELPALDKLYIDIGATSRDNCPVRIGEVAAFDCPYAELGGRLVAKSMDNRIGVLVAIEALRSLKPAPYDIYFVFTTQHEVGGRGVIPSTHGIDPDLGIAVDVTPAEDTSLTRGIGIALGKGPCIKIQDAGMIADARVVDWMVRAAEKSKIVYQREVSSLAGTDAKGIQPARAGVPSGCVSIPVRYLHSSSEMVEFSDVQSAVRLLTAILHTPIEL